MNEEEKLGMVYYELLEDLYQANLQQWMRVKKQNNIKKISDISVEDYKVIVGLLYKIKAIKDKAGIK
jgi:hypothetical protein